MRKLINENLLLINNETQVFFFKLQLFDKTINSSKAL